MATSTPKKSKSPKSQKTPSRKEVISQSTSPKSSPNRNLSDVAKRLRDCCATWHEHVNKWSKLNELGTSLANKLVNLQLQKEYNAVEESTTLSLANDQDLAFKLQGDIPKASQELSRIYSSLADLHTKMEALVQNFHAIRKLQSIQRNNDNGSDNRIFNTWTIERFCDASQRLLDSFTKELSLKERLVTEFTYCKNRDQLMVYLSLWLHEPLLNDDNDVLLESMLIETELR
ncbi:cyclin-dependent kinase 2-interacting protein-like [Orbicella faveolata]|uniref:cyclin-dependent kinase 2-interacting protein-like n=1 Tax=Orbicella faveolata TaxID=48498 RepID=UPI0009E53B92|nr:cyclin-dependent kinase 2-interacting protein-like [Orbicella faveolata]